MNIADIIRRKSVKPVVTVETLRSSGNICVTFRDGSSVQAKDDNKLKIFFMSIQNLEFERIDGDTSHCVTEHLDFFKLLGFCSGENISVYKNDVSLPILFS
jgi:hypothetical protein